MDFWICELNLFLLNPRKITSTTFCLQKIISHTFAANCKENLSILFHTLDVSLNNKDILDRHPSYYDKQFNKLPQTHNHITEDRHPALKNNDLFFIFQPISAFRTLFVEAAQDLGVG